MIFSVINAKTHDHYDIDVLKMVPHWFGLGVTPPQTLGLSRSRSWSSLCFSSSQSWSSSWCFPVFDCVALSPSLSFISIKHVIWKWRRFQVVIIELETIKKHLKRLRNCSWLTDSGRTISLQTAESSRTVGWGMRDESSGEVQLKFRRPTWLKCLQSKQNISRHVIGTRRSTVEV